MRAAQFQERSVGIILFLRVSRLLQMVLVRVGGYKFEFSPGGVPGVGGPPVFHVDGDNCDVVAGFSGGYLASGHISF